ncbi:hypothetical protein C9I91_09020 [Photobacterium jeanii]|nr:hypothetical protein C9I91_09020 [Photobacterium jeanii]
MIAAPAFATSSYDFSDPTKTATAIQGEVTNLNVDLEDNASSERQTANGKATIFGAGITSEVFNNDGVRAAFLFGYNYLDRAYGRSFGEKKDTDAKIDNGHRNSFKVGFAAAKDFDSRLVDTVYTNFNYYWLQESTPLFSEGYDLNLTAKLSSVNIGSGELNFYPSYTYTQMKSGNKSVQDESINSYAVRIAYAMEAFSVYAEPKRVDGKFVYGLGAGYNFTDDFVIGARYEQYTESHNKIKLDLTGFTLALDYRF